MPRAWKPGGIAPESDLLSFVDGTAGRDVAVSELGFDRGHMIHVRHRDWKYLFYQNGGFEELYDLRVDPHELDDLSGNSAHEDKCRELRKVAADYLARHGWPEMSLDDSGDLKALPYEGPESAGGPRPNPARPYSRMPWDCRVPQSILPEEQTPWWWREVGGDWSVLVDMAKRVSAEKKKKND